MIERIHAISNKVKRHIQHNETDTAFIIVDRFLEEILREFCVMNGCTAETATSDKKSKLFGSWVIPDYLTFLDTVGSISRQEKAVFFKYHEMRNSIQHKGLKPAPTQVRDFLKEIQVFIQRLDVYEQALSSYPRIEKLEVSDIVEEDLYIPIAINHFLIENGLHLENAEKYLNEHTLKHIDLKFKDKDGCNLYVEIKLNDFSFAQVKEYFERLSDQEKKFRLMWLVPTESVDKIKKKIESQFPSVEVKGYDLPSILKLINIRREAREILTICLNEINEPIIVPKGFMYQYENSFPNLISALLFRGTVKTDKGNKIIGMRQYSLARYFDLIRSVARSTYGIHLSPDLTLILVYELLMAPYSSTNQRQEPVIHQNGFYQYLTEPSNSRFYSFIIPRVSSMKSLLDVFMKKHYEEIKTIYARFQNYDLLYRILHENETMLKDLTLRSLVPGKRLYPFFRTIFNIQTEEPIQEIHHLPTNQVVKNIADRSSPDDVAFRLIQMSSAKGILLPVTGLSDMWVPVYKKDSKGNRFVLSPAQAFQFNETDKYFKQFTGMEVID